jgi:hypothetical protein
LFCCIHINDGYEAVAAMEKISMPRPVQRLMSQPQDDGAPGPFAATVRWLLVK